MNGRENGKMIHSRSPFRWMLFSLPLIFLVLFYFYPLGKIVVTSFFPEGFWDPGKLSRLFSSTYLGIIWFTCWQAALSTILTLVLALPGAYVFARFNFAGKTVLQSMMTVPFVLPTVVTAAAFRALLGTNGVINSWLMTLFGLEHPPLHFDQTIYFLLIAHVFYNYTLILRVVSSYWAGLNKDLQGAAEMLGASPWQSFREITLPLLLPAIGSASILVFIFCFTSFGVILILGGPGYATMEVEIYRQTVQLFNLPMAAALSLIQIGINFLLMWLHARLSKRSKVSFYADVSTGQTKSPKKFRERLIVGANLTFMVLLLVTPLAALVIRSFTGEHGPTLAYYSALFTSTARSVFYVEPIEAVTNSLGFALGAMAIAVILGLLASTFLAGDRSRRSSFWDALIMLPLATSAVTLGFGYIITLNKPPLNLRDSIALVPIAHALVAFPFVVRCILPSLRQIPQAVREAAIMLGSSPGRVWYHIDLPMIRRPLLVAAVFAFSISMGEFGASAFVTRPHTPTMPVAIFRFLSQPGELNYGQAMAMSSILMLVTGSSFWFISKLDHFRSRSGRMV